MGLRQRGLSTRKYRPRSFRMNLISIYAAEPFHEGKGSQNTLSSHKLSEHFACL